MLITFVIVLNNIRYIYLTLGNIAYTLKIQKEQALRYECMLSELKETRGNRCMYKTKKDKNSIFLMSFSYSLIGWLMLYISSYRQNINHPSVVS